MAFPLPTNLVVGSSGHVGHHNTIHAFLNTREHRSEDGYHIVDYGAVADNGVTDNLPKIIACVNDAIAHNNYTIIFDSPKTIDAYYGISASIDNAQWGAGPGNRGLHFKGVSGGSPHHLFQFARWPVVPVRHMSGGPLFINTNDSGSTDASEMAPMEITGIGAYLCQLYDGTTANGKLAALVTIERNACVCAATGVEATMTPVRLKNTFWGRVRDNALNAGFVNTTLSANITFPVAVVPVASTIGIPVSGEVIVGDLGIAGTTIVRYTGKTANSLTGCTVDGSTASYTAGQAVHYGAPWLTIRGNGQPSYLLDIGQNIGSGSGARYYHETVAGPVPAALFFERNDIEGFYGASFDFINNSGAPAYLHDVVMAHTTQNDSLAPYNGHFGNNAVLRTRGADETFVYQTELRGNDGAFAGGVLQVYQAHASSRFAGTIRGVNTITPAVSGHPASVFDVLFESSDAAGAAHFSSFFGTPANFDELGLTENVLLGLRNGIVRAGWGVLYGYSAGPVGFGDGDGAGAGSGIVGRWHAVSGADPSAGFGVNGDCAVRIDGTAAAKNVLWHKEAGAWVKLVP